MNILLIEDEKALSASAVMQLEMKGHQVDPAYDLKQARSALEQEGKKYQVVIADHQLPDGLGIQFIQEVRESRPECVFAIVSGHLGEREIESLKAAGIPFFQKPLIYSKVLDQLRRSHLMNAPVMELPKPEPENESIAVESDRESKPKRKRRFGLF